MTSDIATLQPNPFEIYGRAAVRRPEHDLMKFQKGDYVAGKHGNIIHVGSEFVAAMDTLSVGYLDWKNNVPIDRIMGRIVEGFVPPRRSELGQTDQSIWELDDSGKPRDPLQLTNEIVLISRKNIEEVYCFTTSSRGGLQALGILSKEYGTRIRQNPNDWPVTKLETDSYQHPNRSYGRIKTPKFAVIGWVNKAPYTKALEGGNAAELEDVPFG